MSEQWTKDAQEQDAVDSGPVHGVDEGTDGVSSAADAEVAVARTDAPDEVTSREADPAGDAAEVEVETSTDEDAGDDGASVAEAAGSGGQRRQGGRGADLVREGEVAADFLETLLDICDLDGDLDVDVDGDRAAVAIVDSEEGRVPRRLVGTDGHVLEALQELTRLAVQSETGERTRLMLDVAGHRAERRAKLVAVAKEAIERVKASGESASLDPMSAFERKVVHDEVLAAGLHSESAGTEPRRFVVITTG